MDHERPLRVFQRVSHQPHEPTGHVDRLDPPGVVQERLEVPLEHGLLDLFLVLLFRFLGLFLGRFFRLFLLLVRGRGGAFDLRPDRVVPRGIDPALEGLPVKRIARDHDARILPALGLFLPAVAFKRRGRYLPSVRIHDVLLLLLVPLREDQRAPSRAADEVDPDLGADPGLRRERHGRGRGFRGRGRRGRERLPGESPVRRRGGIFLRRRGLRRRRVQHDRRRRADRGRARRRRGRDRDFLRVRVVQVRHRDFDLVRFQIVLRRERRGDVVGDVLRAAREQGPAGEGEGFGRARRGQRAASIGVREGRERNESGNGTERNGTEIHGGGASRSVDVVRRHLRSKSKLLNAEFFRLSLSSSVDAAVRAASRRRGRAAA
eukprot:29404-Pelagococcus_subviridis.AAC.10